ncbi:MAG: DUF2306 domain-containing protein [Roseobacter sp.]
MRAQSRKSEWPGIAFVFCLLLISFPFAYYSVHKGLTIGDPQEQISSRLFQAEAPVSTAAIYAHMSVAGVLMMIAPLQLLRRIRNRMLTLHRWLGYMTAICAVFIGASGLLYIVTIGTIGGPVMDLGFGLYGVLMVVAPLRTVQLARRRDPRHRLWAERLIILVLASWLYRIHYGVWQLLTGGAGSSPDFSGPFDLVQVFAFYLPYLAVHGVLSRKIGHKSLPKA